jgi:ParB-like chromosome segregation protein Spo0J
MENGRSWPADKVERRKISSIVPYARNSRTHSDEQVAQIASSIKEWGFTNPILVDIDGEIIAGHGRLLAAQKLGLDEVPCITAVGWSEAQKKAYVIADNKLAINAGWDVELLRIELDELTDLNFDVNLTGFSDDEILNLSFDNDAEAEMPDLADGDREPFQQMTFTMHDDQAEEVRAAIEKAKAMGPFVETANENGNGNALARICETFNGLS